ncbi:MAG: cyclomaltodextrinase N-terminal domain-containing protein [Bacteroidetes bacterium]|nr:cyclomaltodextrinase N-terminal domain-containing protein [Bacteroidota bacterium]MCW5894798.1 cyclomaltodextrinase N-terminal domain-containing protein [Bacteroidota bacterium]
MKKSLLVALAFCALHLSFAQTPVVTKIEPPNWWAGMKTNILQLMIYGENLKDVGVTSSSPGIRILKVHEIENPSYAFVDIEIRRNATPGNYGLRFRSGSGEVRVSFPLLQRRNSDDGHNGFDQSDVIYLIVPDRFANGDASNDNISGMSDTLNRNEPYGRHGGDLQGIINKLDYLQDLGVTALWLTPVVENNVRASSYHGYAATDLYRIDRRFGSNELYRTFVQEAHTRNLKVIMDHVNNHISISHPWIQNLPTPDWLNGSPDNHLKSYHSKAELTDLYSDSLTKQKATHGWFTPYMPDMNQKNSSVARYLTQSTIWWIEYSGIDGIREDTYPYIDPEFRARWCRTILDEYPRFNIVGEVWIQDPVYLAPYQRKSFFPKPLDPQLPAITDFGLFDAFMKAFADSAGKIEHIFNCLTKDFLFPDPGNLVTFLDNHDIRRIMFNVNGDTRRFQMAMTLLLTTRGIPQILYGTELGMKGGPDHGRLRADFPGGFPGDTQNAFTEEERTETETDIFNFTKRLLHIRKAHPVLQTGKLIHFKPTNEVYVYFRILKNERLMVVINNNRDKQTVDLSPFEHQLVDVVRLRDMLSGNEFDLSAGKSITLDGMSAGIFEIVKEME